MSTLVEFINVTKSFGQQVALSGFSLTVASGEFVALMGPSGCGKTTALRLLAGFETPDAGEIHFAGHGINHLKPWQRNVPLVWQNLALFPFLTVIENVEFGLKMRGVKTVYRRQQALAWLARLCIEQFADQPVNQLSGGQKQRVALARTLVTEPDILLLDEPLSALDANMVTHMQNVLTNLQRELGITFLYVTHSRAEAFAMADRVVVINQGKLCQMGSPAEIYQAPHNRFIAQFIGDNNLLVGQLVSRQGECCVVNTVDGEWRASYRSDSLTPRLGDAVDMVINTTAVSVSGSPLPDFDNTVAGTLENDSFAGDSSRLQLKTTAGTIIEVKRHIDTAVPSDWSYGTTLFAQWNARSLRLLEQETTDE